jgi:hypothetical protein
MKTLKKNVLKSVQAAAVVLALSFSGTANATTSAYALTGGVWSWESFFSSLTNSNTQTSTSTSSSGGSSASAFASATGGKTFTFTFTRVKPKKPKTSIPLDGGLSILVLGAAAFGVKKLRGTKGEAN